MYKLSNVRLIQKVDETTSRNTPRATIGEGLFETVAYPVPFNNQLSTHLNHLIAGEIRVMLYDTSGRLVLKTNQEHAFNNGPIISLNTNALNPGAYFYRVEILRNSEIHRSPSYKLIKF
jgi:hypothetical protein